MIISVSHLSKYYQVHKKEAGLIGSIKSLFARKYEEIKAVNDISFEINEGELVGFIGPNGAGKTTTLKVLSGLLYPTFGQVKIASYTPWERNPEFQKLFAFVAGQKNQLWWDLPPSESFLLNKEIYEITDLDFKERINSLSQMLDVASLLTTPVKKLSLGQRMKCELIAALIHQPKILFLDEPTIGLDIIAQNKMREFIKNYNQQFDATILLTSHYMGDMEKLCKRVLIINRGKILYDGKLSLISAKYSKTKTITLDFAQEVKREELEEFGNILKFSPMNITIEVRKDEVAEITHKLLKNFSIVDLTIEETPIEEVISNIFTQSNE